MPKSNLNLFIFALVFMVLAGGMAWWITLNTNPVAVVPTPTLPIPNAFDDFVAAGNAVVNSKLVDAATVDDGAGAATLKMKQDAVAINPVAPARLRIGFTKKYWTPPARSFDAMFPFYAKFRGMARLLKVEGQVKAASGDWNGAVQSNLDAMQIGVTIPHGAVLIGMLVGLACEAIGRKDLWMNLQHLNAAQSHAAAQRLEAMDRDRFAYSATMQEEKWLTQASLLEIFRHGDVFQMFRSLASSWGASGTPVFDPEFLLYSKRTMFNNVTQSFNAQIRRDSLPYYQSSRLSPLPIPPDPLSKILLPVFAAARFKAVTNDAEDALLETTLALRAYNLEHHAYPVTLMQLTPSYLARVPDDPFAATGQLKYNRIGSSYVLYSVGPDGKDDGGKPVLESTTGTNRFMETTSTGDVVAGVTIH